MSTADATSPTWRMTLPEGWVVWTPGSPDTAALVTSVTTRRGALVLRQGIGELEAEVARARGNVVQVGVRLVDPAALTGSMRLTYWPRGGRDGKALDAGAHLADLRSRPQDRARLFEHREVSLTSLPAGQAVLSNEISRRRWGVRSTVSLATDIFPRGSAAVFRLHVTSRYRELQPTLMADLSLMAHSFTVEDAGTGEPGRRPAGAGGE